MNLHKKTLDIIILCLSFLFIFAVSFKGIPNFSYIGILFLPLIILLVPNNKIILKNAYSVLTDKSVFYTNIIFILLILWTFTYAVFRNTYDYAFIQPVLHIIVSIPACVFISSYIFESRKGQYNNLKPVYSYFFIILFSQTFFILLMLFSPSIADYINTISKSEAQLERMATYGGSRGLGLSGSVAFGLSVVMAQLVYIVFFLKLINQNYKTKASDYILLLLSSMAALSAGRTAIAGSILALLTIILINMYALRLGSLFKGIIVFPTVLLVIVIILLATDSEAIRTYIFYVFQPIQQYLKYGNFQVSSIEGLNNMYFIPTSESTLLIGDARYVNPNGFGYYMGTDAGYMRYLLFYGLPVSVIIYILWTKIIIIFYKKVKEVLPFSFIFFLSILVLSFIFQYKGEFIFVAVSFYKIFFILVYYLVLLTKNKRKTIS